jgi:hypothetical protein
VRIDRSDVVDLGTTQLGNVTGKTVLVLEVRNVPVVLGSLRTP